MSKTTLAARPSDSPPTPASRHAVLRLVNRLRVEIIDAMDRELAPFEISAPQLFVLSTLTNEEVSSPSAICKSISYDPGAMTRMIDRLEQKGLVRRIPHPTDRRATSLELTTAGKALYPQLLAAKDRVQAQFLRGFSEEEVRVFERFLHRMLENR